MRSLSISEARENFDEMIESVRNGDAVEIVDAGRVVATITPKPEQPAAAAPTIEERRRALNELFELLRSRPVMNLGKFDRNAMWEEYLTEKGLL